MKLFLAIALLVVDAAGEFKLNLFHFIQPLSHIIGLGTGMHSSW